uniref:Uncharacterized protein n=1 Tax=Rhizophora mucronata TaxID=61149 RepID=A0A2P2IHB0_RHIMU
MCKKDVMLDIMVSLMITRLQME